MLSYLRNVLFSSKNINYRSPNYNLICLRFLSNDKAIKTRIKTVKSIEKITKAMKMVAASKLRAKEIHKNNGDVFSEPVLSFFEYVRNNSTPSLQHQSNTPSTTLVVSVSTDKGLCGAINSSVIRYSNDLVKRNETLGHNVKIIGIGERIRSNLLKHHPNKTISIYKDLSRNPVSFYFSSILASKIKNINCNICSIVFNKFNSMMSYQTTEYNLVAYSTLLNSIVWIEQNFDCEPEIYKTLEILYEFYLAISLYKCFLDNDISEQSSRRISMENASNNASDMLSDLTLKFNNSRQSKITMELMEIISGASSVSQ